MSVFYAIYHAEHDGFLKNVTGHIKWVDEVHEDSIWICFEEEDFEGQFCLLLERLGKFHNWPAEQRDFVRGQVFVVPIMLHSDYKETGDFDLDFEFSIRVCDI